MSHVEPLKRLPRASLTASVRIVLCALLLVLLSAGTTPSAPLTATIDASASGTAIGIPSAADPSIYSVSIIAAGQSPQYGDFRALARHVTDATTGEFTEGVLTLEFLSGDKLYASYTGSEAATSSPDVFTASGTVIFTGGTGQFAGVTGRATFGGQFQIVGISPTGVVREAVMLQLQGRLKF